MPVDKPAEKMAITMEIKQAESLIQSRSRQLAILNETTAIRYHYPSLQPVATPTTFLMPLSFLPYKL